MTDGKMLISIGVVAVLVLAVLGGVAIANNNSSNNNGVTDSSDSNAVIESSNNNNAASVPVVEQASVPVAEDADSISESASPASESAAVVADAEPVCESVAEVGTCYPALTDDALVETMVKDMMSGAATSSLIGQYTDADGKLIESDADIQSAMAMLAEDFGMTYEEYSQEVMNKVFAILDANGYDVMPIESTTSTALAHEHMYDENGVCVICNEGLSDS